MDDRLWWLVHHIELLLFSVFEEIDVGDVAGGTVNPRLNVRVADCGWDLESSWRDALMVGFGEELGGRLPEVEDLGLDGLHCFVIFNLFKFD
jgi:hypothetical protein